MLLLLFSGSKGASPAPALKVTKCCFQPKAFQKNAFQNCGFTGGWIGRFRHDPTDLERRLSRQKSERKWFDEFISAATSARDRADKTKSEPQRRALICAVDTAADAVADAIEEEREIPPWLIDALRAAANASRVTASIKHAEAVIAMVADWEDEEEILMLLQ